jgi:hypothetical protein
MKEIWLGSAKSPLLIDDCDEALISSRAWRVGSHGYARINVKAQGKQMTVLLHRALLGLLPGDKREVDHINGNKLDNRRCNLRLCEKRQNGANRGKQSNNRSGFKGVEWHKASRKWCARIGYRNRSIHLGMFDSPELAHEFYSLAADLLHEQFANYGDAKAKEWRHRIVDVS